MTRTLAIALASIGDTLLHTGTVPVTTCGQVIGRGRRASWKNVDASGNATGATVHDVKAIGFVADGNRYAGLFSYEGAHVSRSHLTGNTGADIATFLAPRVVATTCDHRAGLVAIDPSGVFDLTGPPWGVCTGD